LIRRGIPSPYPPSGGFHPPTPWLRQLLLIRSLRGTEGLGEPLGSPYGGVRGTF